MQNRSPEAVHVWLVLLKSFQAIARLASKKLTESGLGDSDFRVLEVLLHKGPQPVNAIGPKVNLTPGSISVAVDRLFKRGLVSRTEGDDRRVRVVSLTVSGRAIIEPAFREHAKLMESVMEGLNNEDRTLLEHLLKLIGKRADKME